MNKKIIETALHEPLSANGFMKKGPTWYRKTDDVLQVFNLQKSSFGGQFYVNLCYVPERVPVEGMPTPKEHKCPIRIRLTSLFPDDRERISSLFDLENKAFDTEERVKEMRKLISRSVLAFFERTNSSHALRAAIEKGTFDGGAVSSVALNSLGVVNARE